MFAFAVEDIDFDRGVVEIRRQIHFVAGKMVFAPPKGGKVRGVPLPDRLAGALKAHMKAFPPKRVTLPWRTADGTAHTVSLLFTDDGNLMPTSESRTRSAIDRVLPGAGAGHTAPKSEGTCPTCALAT
ncbi:hypothetical protein [Kitasatospora purpeofusca]|uniref:hypothetical protein n=1 Tax=Kitasatospora purpeofusca TaxID=67352 RepID=UPI002A5989DD|nr:hypothetical protein [Kitasatospora purpeofusca]MDY0811004.1 hypothetical protein [Kitasatospora purpeofusca]